MRGFATLAADYLLPGWMEGSGAFSSSKNKPPSHMPKARAVKGFLKISLPVRLLARYGGQPPTRDLITRAANAHPFHPAALAFVSYGIMLV